MIKKLFLLIITSLIIQSCASKKDILYYQDVVDGSQTSITRFSNTVQINDVLYIKIAALIPESVEAFNIQMGSLSGGGSSSYKLQGYLVDQDGTIAFSILGNIKVAGLSLLEIQNKISKLLIDNGYVKDPTVSVRIVNFKVTILGEVRSPGTYNFDEQSISLNQAIGYAGDLTLNGIRKDVLLIREVDGTRTYTRLDLTLSNLLNSPSYYVKQNDVIIVNPNGPKVMTSGYLNSIGAGLGIISFALTLFLLLKK